MLTDHELADHECETTACAACGERDFTVFFVGPDQLHAGPERFQLVRCRACGHIYQNPRPTVPAMARFYPPSYIPFATAIRDEPRWWRRLDRQHGLNRRCQAVQRAAGGSGRLLDIGCATGIFLAGMRSLGWRVWGIEPTASAASYARERLGLDVLTGRLEDFALAPAQFDAVTLWDVLEHVHEPQAMLAQIATILKPGGLLVICLPNPASLEARLFKRHWLGWDLPRHLNLFQPDQLQAVLGQHGLRVERIRSFTAGYSLLLMSLAQALRARGWPTTLLMRLLGSIPCRMLAWPYYAGPANWWNLSSNMVLFARRDHTAAP